VASILRYIPRGVFDDVAMKVMGDAFDAACRALRDTGQPDVVQEVMAQRILVAARNGERDARRLRDAALAALPPRSRPFE
jgi:hypothetical protein